MAREKNKTIKKATVEIVKMSEDEKMERLAFLRQKAIMDEKSIYAAGVDKGKEEGTKNEKIQIAKEMKKENIPIETIAKVTKLTIEEIEKL